MLFLLVQSSLTEVGLYLSLSYVRQGMESWDMDNGENIVDAGKQKKEGSARYMGPTIQNYRSTSFLVQ